MQSKSPESKGYSQNIVIGRLHQNSDLEVIKCDKTCKRGPAWSCDVNNTWNVSCDIPPDNTRSFASMTEGKQPRFNFILRTNFTTPLSLISIFHISWFCKQIVAGTIKSDLICLSQTDSDARFSGQPTFGGCLNVTKVRVTCL